MLSINISETTTPEIRKVFYPAVRSRERVFAAVSDSELMLSCEDIMNLNGAKCGTKVEELQVKSSPKNGVSTK
jgi:hypothetical protein